MFVCSVFVFIAAFPLARTYAADRDAPDQKVQAVIDEVDKICRQQTVYMIGPEKAKRLAELVRQKKPGLVVECGTAIGYSGLWIARELKAAGTGKLITIEIDQDHAVVVFDRAVSTCPKSTSWISVIVV
jgi:predicted O-methyltransferase YrrM